MLLNKAIYYKCDAYPYLQVIWYHKCFNWFYIYFIKIIEYYHLSKETPGAQRQKYPERAFQRRYWYPFFFFIFINFFLFSLIFLCLQLQRHCFSWPVFQLKLSKGRKLWKQRCFGALEGERPTQRAPGNGGPRARAAVDVTWSGQESLTKWKPICCEVFLGSLESPEQDMRRQWLWVEGSARK